MKPTPRRDKTTLPSWLNNLVGPLSFEVRPYGWLYIATVSFLVFALFRARSLPSVDYPQHLALSASLARSWSEGSLESQLYETNLVSYNTLFHLLIALAAKVVAVDDAGKIAVAISFVTLASSFVALLRSTGRPEERAFALLPLLPGYLFAWGFFNTQLGLGIQLHALALFLGRERIATPLRWKTDMGIALLGVLGAYAHAPATAMAYVVCFVLLMSHLLTGAPPLGLRFGQVIRMGLPFLPAILYCAIIFKSQQSSHFNNWEYAGAEGYDDLAMRKAKGMFATAAGLRADGLDQVPLVGLLSLVLFEFLAHARESKPLRAGSLTMLTGLFLYFVIPHVFLGTNYMYQRMLVLAAVGLILSAPRTSTAMEKGVRPAYAMLGVVTAFSFWSVMGEVAKDFSALESVIEKAPPGRKMATLVYDRNPPSIAQPSFLHAGGYYVARKGGELAMSFTRTMSLPLHYRKEKVPPIPPTNFEWQPESYRNQNTSAFAKHFDLLLIHAPQGANADPTWGLLGYYPNEAKVLAREGRWWLVERLPTTITRPEDFE